MTAIWHKTGNEWAILSPSGFPDEAALHSLVEEAPHVLPLSGEPRLVVLDREVRLGSGSADRRFLVFEHRVIAAAFLKRWRSIVSDVELSLLDGEHHEVP